MRKWFWAWKKQSSTRQPQDSIEGEIEEHGGKEVVPSKYELSQTEFLFPFRYEWEIESAGSGGNQITETAFVSRSWTAFCILSHIGICVFVGLFALFSGLYEFLALVAIFTSAICFVASYVILISSSSPIDRIIDEGTGAKMYIPAASYLLLYLPLLLATLIFPGIVRFLSIAGVFLLSAIYWWRHRTVVETSLRWQGWVERKSESIPVVAGKYVAALTLGTVSPFVFIVIYDSPVIQTLLSNEAYVGIFLISGIFLITLELTRNTVQHGSQISEIKRFTDQGINLSSTGGFVTTAIITVSASLLYAYLSYLFFQASASFLSTYSSIPALFFLFVSGLPILYFGTGIVYQVYSVIGGFRELKTRTRRHDFSDVYDADAETYLLESSELLAGALTTGQTDYIVVSEGYRELLDDRELASVIAHEEGHLKNRDAGLAAANLVFASFLLTGKNVLFALMNFRKREFEADRYAARKTSRSALRDALFRIQIHLARKKTENTDKISGIIPTMIAFNDNGEVDSLFSQHFEFFYGTFAVTEAHPGLDERLDRLRSN